MVKNGVVVLDGGFDGETVVVDRVPICASTVNGTFVGGGRRAKTWRANGVIRICHVNTEP